MAKFIFFVAILTLWPFANALISIALAQVNGYTGIAGSLVIIIIGVYMIINIQKVEEEE